MWYYWKGPNPDKSVIKYIEDNYRKDWTYADFGPLVGILLSRVEIQFTAELFDPKVFRDIIEASGARFISRNIIYSN